MKTAKEILEILQKKFPEIEFSLVEDEPSDQIIFTDALKIHEICEFLRDGEGLKFDTLMNLSGVDDANGEKQTNDDGSETIVGGTLSVYYNLDSIELNHKTTLQVSTSRESPKVESVNLIWRAADWHEREAYDMLGIKFLNHPDLRRILMPYDWEEGSYPLRKDYKDPEFYQGMKVPY